MLSSTYILAKSVEMNIFHVNNRRGALCFPRVVKWITQRAHCPLIEHYNLVILVKFGSNSDLFKLIEAEWRIYASFSWVIIGLDNGLSPVRRQAIIWTNTGILLIGRLGTNFNEILIGIPTFSFKKLHLKTSSAKWRLFCFGFNELMQRTLPLVNVGTESAIVWVAIIIMHMLLIFFKWQLLSSKRWVHYSDTIMSAMAFQITSLTIVYSIVYSGADQRKHQSSASMAFVRGIHRSPLNSPHKWPVTREMFPFDGVIVLIVRRAGLLWSQRDFEWRWSVPLFKCLTVLEFSFILFDLCLLITFFNFIMNYVPIVTFWIFTYHKIWILSIMFCSIWSYWIIYFLACLEVSWRVVS